MIFNIRLKIKPNYGIKTGSIITMLLSNGWIPHTVTNIDEEGRIFGIEYDKTREEYLFSLHHISSFLRSNELKIGLYKENELKNIR